MGETGGTGEGLYDETRAWEELEQRLEEHLGQLVEDQTLVVELPQDAQEGAAPYVQFCAWGEDMLRCEAVSNHYLGESWALTDAGAGELVALGFHAPTYTPEEEADSGSANFYVDGERNQADDMAWMAVKALREVYGVAHPLLLQADGLLDPAPEEVSAEEDTSDHECVTLESIVPKGPEQLQELVDAQLEQMLGHPPHKDDDGDIPIRTERGVVWVSVHPSRPVVDVFGRVLSDVTDRQLALHELAILNRDDLGLQYVLRGDSIGVQARVDAMPFAPAHLQRVVESMCAAVDRAHDDLAPRFARRQVPGGEDSLFDSLDEDDE
jgi:hypothetical protein